MARYVLETDRKIACCFDCPMLFDDMCLATGRENYDEKDIRPSWCPLTLDDDIVSMDDLESLFENFKGGGCTCVTVDGEEYRTDWGYGEEGIKHFLDALRRRLGVRNDTQDTPSTQTS